MQKKKDGIEEKKAVIMPVSIATDTTVYELKIAPDTFSVLSEVVPAVLINHSDEDAYYGDDYSYKYYNDSIGKWENAKTPSNLISSYVLWILHAQSENNLQYAVFDKRPGKYRISFNISKPRYLKVESEYVLSTTSDLIVLRKNEEMKLKKTKPSK